VLAVPKKPSRKKPDDIHQIIVRIPFRLYEELAADAEDSSRTVNMHILHLVKERLKERRREQASGEEK
jgi:hypothetical protein